MSKKKSKKKKIVKKDYVLVKGDFTNGVHRILGPFTEDDAYEEKCHNGGEVFRLNGNDEVEY